MPGHRFFDYAEPPERLARAKQMLLIGNAFNYFCSGVAKNEVSLASTTQLYNPQTKTWSKKLLDALKLLLGKAPAAMWRRRCSAPGKIPVRISRHC